MIPEHRLANLARLLPRSGPRPGASSRAALESVRPFPDVVQWVTDPDYLGDVRVYPRQLTFLKLMFLAIDLLTEYDLGVIDELGAGFALRPGDGRYVGEVGTTPDVLKRVQRCRDEGRLWFRDIVAVVGRRGSKGVLGALGACRVLYWYLTRDDPQGEINVDRHKRLSMLVFAGNKAQARANQWRDVYSIIRHAPCFAPFLAKTTSDSILLYSYPQLASGESLVPADAAFEVVAAESTELAVRGRTVVGVLFDEMAGMTGGGSNRPADEIYRAAVPALAQSGRDGRYAFLYQASSPRERIGQLYANHLRALEVDPATGAPRHYDSVTFQLPSWALYEDYEQTHTGTLPMAPNGPAFPVIDEPVLSAEDPHLLREQAIDPENYDVEYRARWHTATDAYVPEDAVITMFGPYRGKPLQTTDQGVLKIDYHGHLDPSVVNDNTALAICHAEFDDDDSLPHVVFDAIDHWTPGSFPAKRIDYLALEAALIDYLDRFSTMVEFTLDQHNSEYLIQSLQAHAQRPGRPERTHVHLRTESEQLKWRSYELFKRFLLAGRIHAPDHPIAREEWLHLRRAGGYRVDHQEHGEVTHNDCCDAMVAAAWPLLQPYATVAAALAMPPSGTMQHGFPIQPNPNPARTRLDDLIQQFRQVHRSPNRFPRIKGSPRGIRVRDPSRGF